MTEITQGDNLDKNRFIVLVCDIGDIEQHTDKQTALKLFNNQNFREHFTDNLMQDWTTSLMNAIEENIKNV